MAVDGSHIDVDRHMPVSCYLVNQGGCSVTYGSQPDAGFFSQPHLAWEQGELFQETLTPGWRSPAYLTNSSVPREYYTRNQQVYFYYLNTGEEIARVEVPRWVAQDEGLLSLGHTLVLDQCPRGRSPGYPGWPFLKLTSRRSSMVGTGRPSRNWCPNPWRAPSLRPTVGKEALQADPVAVMGMPPHGLWNQVKQLLITGCSRVCLEPKLTAPRTGRNCGKRRPFAGSPPASHCLGVASLVGRQWD